MKPHSTHCQQGNQSWYLEVWGKETTRHVLEKDVFWNSGSRRTPSTCRWCGQVLPPKLWSFQCNAQNTAISQALNMQLAGLRSGIAKWPSGVQTRCPLSLDIDIWIIKKDVPTKRREFYIKNLPAMSPAGVKIRTSVHCAWQFYRGSLVSCCGQDMSRVGWHLSAAQKSMTNACLQHVSPKWKLCRTTHTSMPRSSWCVSEMIKALYI